MFQLGGAISIFIVVFMLCVVLSGITMGSASVVGYYAQVVAVGDGDTFTTSTGKRIRIFGIDAPERHQEMGKSCRDALASKIIGKVVKLECKAKSYDREVCAVSLDGSDIGEWIVRNGFAFDEPRYSNGRYLQPEAEAKSRRAGVWKLKNGGERPWDYRRKKKKSRSFRSKSRVS